MVDFFVIIEVKMSIKPNRRKILAWSKNENKTYQHKIKYIIIIKGTNYWYFKFIDNKKILVKGPQKNIFLLLRRHSKCDHWLVIVKKKKLNVLNFNVENENWVKISLTKKIRYFMSVIIYSGTFWLRNVRYFVLAIMNNCYFQLQLND